MRWGKGDHSRNGDTQQRQIGLNPLHESSQKHASQCRVPQESQETNSAVHLMQFENDERAEPCVTLLPVQPGSMESWVTLAIKPDSKRL